MRKQRVAVAQSVVQHLDAAERTNDLAIVATARLAICMLEGRLELNAAAEVGQVAFEAVAATFDRQSSGRQQLIAAHQALLDAKRRVGLETVDIGGAGDKQVPKIGAELTLVASASA